MAQDIKEQHQPAVPHGRFATATTAITRAESAAQVSQYAADGIREILDTRQAVLLSYPQRGDMGRFDVWASPRDETGALRVLRRLAPAFKSRVVGDRAISLDAREWLAQGISREDLPDLWADGIWMVAPIPGRDDNPVGFLLTVRGNAGFRAEDELALTDFARVVGLALENRRMAESLRESKRQLTESEDQFRLATEALNGHLYDWDICSGMVRRTDGVRRLLGVVEGQEEPTARWWQERIHPEDLRRIQANRSGTRRTEDLEYRIRTEDGDYIWVSDRSKPVFDGDGNLVRVIGFAVDINDRKQAQERIANLNGRLQRSMAESHHRIKNNLQVLSAISEMYTINAGDMVPVSVVARLGQQIRTLATLHDLLTMEYRSRTDGGERISLRSALAKMMDMIETVSGGRTIRWECDDVSLPVKRTETFVLLLNELVQNAIKHGRGVVEVAVRATSGTVSLSVADDGKGFPEGFDPREAANTGIELIEAMGRWDLQGTVRYENRSTGGACVTIIFPLPPEEEGESMHFPDTHSVPHAEG